MKNRLACLISAAFLFATPGLRAEEVEGKTGSQANREGKIVGINLELIGLTMLPVQGIRASYFINSDVLLEAGYSFGEMGTESSAGDTKFSKQIIEAKLKGFVWHSLYVDGGLGMEMWDLKYDVATDPTDDEYKELSGTLTNTGVQFHIGNQWQWSSFTLGCDWFGYFLALSTDKNYSDNDDVDEDDKKNEERKITRDLAGSSFHVGRFYLGWTF